MKSPVKPSLRMFSEAARFETLAARAALLALTGDPSKRQEREKIALDHLLRAETFKAAARLIDPQPSTINPQPPHQ